MDNSSFVELMQVRPNDIILTLSHKFVLNKIIDLVQELISANYNVYIDETTYRYI